MMAGIIIEPYMIRCFFQEIKYKRGVKYCNFGGWNKNHGERQEEEIL